MKSTGIDRKTDRSWILCGIEFADSVQGKNAARNKLVSNGFTTEEADQYLSLLEAEYRQNKFPKPKFNIW